MFFKSNKVLGLDIGTSTIKVVEIEVSSRKTSLVSFGIAPTPEGTMSGGEIENPTILSQAIRDLIQKTHSKRNNACVGIWGAAVIVKRVSLPKMDKQLLSEQIRWEAEQYIPYDIQEINLEYHILNSVNEGSETMDILLVAAKKDLIMNYLETVEAAGVSCSILDVSGFALANAFLFNYPEEKTSTVALFDIGCGVTNFVVLENGETVFARDIPAGGFHYTNDISKTLGVSLPEAEGLKLDFSASRPTPEELRPIIQSSHETLCEELNRSLDFFSTTSTQNKIEKIFITGGASQMLGLKEVLGNMTQTAIEFFNPFQKIQIEKGAISPDQAVQISSLAAVAVGLGLRKTGDA